MIIIKISDLQELINNQILLIYIQQKHLIPRVKFIKIKIKKLLYEKHFLFSHPKHPFYNWFNQIFFHKRRQIIQKRRRQIIQNFNYHIQQYYMGYFWNINNPNQKHK
ncbi:hypothetical protein pb186bvf_010855 [Paramecium bursaria]